MMTALTVVFILLTQYVPFFSVIGIFACGIPMACLAARNGFSTVAAAHIAVAAIAFLVTGSIISVISIMLMSVLPGAVAGRSLGSGKGFFSALFAVCIAVCIGWVFELLVVDTLISGNGIEKMLSEMISQTESAMNTIIAALPQSSAEMPDVQALAKTFIDTMKYTLRLYFPSLVIVSSMITGYIILRLCGFVMKRAHIAKVELLPFSMLKAPKSMSFVAVVLYLMFLFAKENTAYWSVLANAVFVLYTIIGVCGLSFVDYKIREKIEKGWIRFIIYAAVLMFGGLLLALLMNVLIIIGIFDSTRDYRKIDAEDRFV